jgi:hypothetical protein
MATKKTGKINKTVKPKNSEKITKFAGNWRDRAWKEVCVALIFPFLDFFYPDFLALLNLDKAPILLSEYSNTPEANTDKGATIVDLCLLFQLKDEAVKQFGTNTITLIIEQQHEYLEEFSYRMLTTYCRMKERHNCDKVISLAIFTSEAKIDQNYIDCCCNNLCKYIYQSFCISSVDEESLLKNEHPIGLVVLAAYKSLIAKGDPKKRLQFGKKLVSILTKRHFDLSTYDAVETFIWRILQLNNSDISPAERKVIKMQGIPLDELQREILFNKHKKAVIKLARAEAKAEGRAEGEAKNRADIARKMIKDGLPVNFIMKYTGLTKKDVTTLKTSLG